MNIAQTVLMHIDNIARFVIKAERAIVKFKYKKGTPMYRNKYRIFCIKFNIVLDLIIALQ